MEISTREIPLQPWGDDFDSGYVLFPVLDRPGGYVAQFGDGSYTPFWVPKGAELDEPKPAELAPCIAFVLGLLRRLPVGRVGHDQLAVAGATLAAIGLASQTLG